MKHTRTLLDGSHTVPALRFTRRRPLQVVRSRRPSIRPQRCRTALSKYNTNSVFVVHRDSAEILQGIEVYVVYAKVESMGIHSRATWTRNRSLFSQALSARSAPFVQFHDVQLGQQVPIEPHAATAAAESTRNDAWRHAISVHDGTSEYDESRRKYDTSAAAGNVATTDAADAKHGTLDATNRAFLCLCSRMDPVSHNRFVLVCR